MGIAQGSKGRPAKSIPGRALTCLSQPNGTASPKSVVSHISVDKIRSTAPTPVAQAPANGEARRVPVQTTPSAPRAQLLGNIPPVQPSLDKIPVTTSTGLSSTKLAMER